MKIHAETGDQKHEVEIKLEGEKLFSDVDGRKYELEVSEPEKGIYLFKYNGKVFEASVSETRGSQTSVRIGANEFNIKLIDPKRLRDSGSEHEHGDGLAEIKTAMPGKVVRVLLKPGTEVEKGDAILIVEAMKMQNELKSPKAGVIKDIRVEAGAAVAAGDVLATIE